MDIELANNLRRSYEQTGQPQQSKAAHAATNAGLITGLLAIAGLIGLIVIIL